MPTPKYEIGQRVHAKVGEFEWDGKIVAIGKMYGQYGISCDYTITNAPRGFGGLIPLIANEEELSPIETAHLVLEEPEATT